jgi:hypothetical protein
LVFDPAAVVTTVGPVEPAWSVLPFADVEAVPLDEAPPVVAEVADADGGQLSASSSASFFSAAANADLSETSCWFAAVTWSCALRKLTAFESFCALVRPPSADDSVLWACSRLASADWSAVCAGTGSILASTCPDLALSPAATSTAVSVPLAAKFTDDDVATLTFPDAVTLDCTVPRATVAVRCTAAPDDEAPRNPYTEFAANKANTAAVNPSAP